MIRNAKTVAGTVVAAAMLTVLTGIAPPAAGSEPLTHQESGRVRSGVTACGVDYPDVTPQMAHNIRTGIAIYGGGTLEHRGCHAIGSS